MKSHYPDSLTFFVEVSMKSLKQELLPKALRDVFTRSHWGLRTDEKLNTVDCVDGNEFIYIAGSRISLLCTDESQNEFLKRPHKVLYPHFPDCIAVHLLQVSPSRKYVAASVTLRTNNKRTANILIYSTTAEDILYRKPKLIQYKCDYDNLIFTLLSFSEDSVYLASSANIPNVGIIIYNWRNDTIINTIQTEPVRCIKFNPEDPSRICTVGPKNLFKMWHFTHRVVHACPIAKIENVGVTRDLLDYQCCLWLSNTRIIAGTTCGCLCLVEGTDLLQTIKVFSDDQNCAKIVKILSKNSYVMVCRDDGKIAVLEAGLVEGKQKKISQFKLSFITVFNVGASQLVRAIGWSQISEFSYTVYISTINCLALYDLSLQDGDKDKSKVAPAVSAGAENLSGATYMSCSTERVLYPSQVRVRDLLQP